MLQLMMDKKERTVLTTWIYKLSIEKRNKKTKSGQKKVYITYSCSFPPELYEFFSIKDNMIYFVKEFPYNNQFIITDTEPKLPVAYVKIKLIPRKKKHSNNTIPTTFFTLSKKLFSNLNETEKIQFILHPKYKDRYRNKVGLITIKTI